MSQSTVATENMARYSPCILRNVNQWQACASVRHWRFTYLQQKNKDKYTILVKWWTFVYKPKTLCFCTWINKTWFSPNIIKTIKWKRMRPVRIAEATVGQREGKKSSGRHTRRWENNTKTDLKETGQEGVDGIHLAQDRDKQRPLVATVMSFGFPQNAMNLLTSWELLACNAEFCCM